MPTTLDAGVPAARFLDPATGDISTPWRMFLVALHNRTGVSGAVSIGLSTAAAQAAADGANVQMIMTDPADPVDLAPALAPALALALVLADDVPPPPATPDDPYLAALLVADAP